MKPFAAAALLLACLVRLSLWAGERERALDACATLEARRSAGQYTSLTGDWEAREGGVLRLASAGPDGRGAWDLPAYLDPDWVRRGPEPGRRARVLGPWRCVRSPRNPSTGVWGRPHLTAHGKRFFVGEAGTASAIVRGREAFRRWLGRRLAEFSGLRALSLATWTGDAGGLPAALRDLYREGGLLHVLALSGEHVAVLAALLGAIGAALVPLVDRLGGARLWAALGRWRYLGAAMALALTADPLAPLCRSLAMVAASETLGGRSLHVRALGIAASASAAVLLWDPALVDSASFWLSVVATLWLSEMTQESLPPLRSYLRLAWRMPIASFPLSAFLFGKIAWLSPITNALVGALWSTVVLPVGFLAPVLPNWALRLLEVAWQRSVAFQEAWGAGPLGYETVIRPSWAEALAWETLLVIALLPKRPRAPVSRSAIP